MTSVSRNVHEALDLDKHCFHILMFMLGRMMFEEQPIRYNQLHQLLKSAKLTPREMSKPTFNEHITHLVQRGYVIRNQLGKQHVEFFLTDKFSELVEAKDMLHNSKQVGETISKKSRSMDLHEVAIFITKLVTRVFLDETRILIKDVLEPKERFHHVTSFSLLRSYLQILQRDMIDRSRRDKEACIFTLKVLDEAIDIIGKELDTLLGIEDS